MDARVTRQVKEKCHPLLTMGAFMADGRAVSPGTRNHINGRGALDTNVAHASTLVTLLGGVATLLKVWHGEDTVCGSDRLLENNLSMQL